jgi:alpha-aminoadipate carrier protein LysW
MPKTYCPECDTVVGVQNPKMGHLFICPECGTELEVVSLEPFDVYFPSDADWEEDDDQEEDWSDDGRRG